MNLIKLRGRTPLIAAAAVIIGLSGCKIVTDDPGDNDGSDAAAATAHTHTWGAWVTTTPATCSAPGVETRVCTQDANHSETQSIPRLTGTACETPPGDTPGTTPGGPRYESVTIGGKTWMTLNLNVETDNSWCYDGDGANCDKYGRLYTWDAAKTACPSGWRLPSRQDWQNLADAAGGGDGGGANLKAADGWNNGGNGTNALGFSALPGGFRYTDGGFRNAGTSAFWWTDAEDDGGYAFYRGTHSDNGRVNEGSRDKNSGQSVRCVSDGGTPPVNPPVTPTPTYTVTVVSAGPGASGGGNYAAGTTVGIYAGAEPVGQKFKNWTAVGATLPNPSSALTTFAMPANAVTVTAVFEPTGGTTPPVTPPDGGGVVAGNNNCTSAATCKSKQMPDGRVWMTENLNIQTADSWCYGEGGEVVSMGDYGEPIFRTPSSLEIQANCNRYGRLYTWPAAKAACPSGWHLPSLQEWGALAEAAGGTGVYGHDGSAGKALKSTSGWGSNSSYNGTDQYGFSALPGGTRISDGYFFFVGESGYWWTTERGSDDAYDRGIHDYIDNLSMYYYPKANALSVRCVAD